MKVGFVGIGHMGKGIARNILKSEIVKSLSIFDVSQQNLDQFRESISLEQHGKLKLAKSLGELSKECDYIGLSLPSEIAVENALFDDDGIVPAARKNVQKPIIIDHGTSSREFILKTFARAKKLDIDYLDAPVSGGPGGAAAGTLTIMIGGNAEIVTNCKPLLSLYAHNVFHFGETGTGMAAKLINQALVGVHAQAACEALLMAERFNIKGTNILLEMLKTSWGQSKLLELTFADYIKAEKSTWEIVQNSGAPLRNLEKDFSCISKDINAIDIKNQLSTQLPLTERTHASIGAACQKGLANDAFVSLLQILRTDSSSTL